MSCLRGSGGAVLVECCFTSTETVGLLGTGTAMFLPQSY